MSNHPRKSPGLVFAVVLLLGCGEIKPIPTPPAGPYSCETACERGADLGCAYAAPTPAGASCGEVCRNVQSSGFLRWDLECRTLAPSCEAVDNCDR